MSGRRRTAAVSDSSIISDTVDSLLDYGVVFVNINGISVSIHLSAPPSHSVMILFSFLMTQFVISRYH